MQQSATVLPCRATRTFIVHRSSVSIVNVLEIQRSIISFRLAVHSQTSCTNKTKQKRYIQGGGVGGVLVNVDSTRC